MQPSGNHQVQHQPQLLINADRDSLADAPEPANRAPFNCAQEADLPTAAETPIPAGRAPASDP